MNKYGRTIILMCAFVKRENIKSYRFALESFTYFGYNLPLTVMTDQDLALKAALADTWNSSKHLYCIFHIYRNIRAKIGKYLGTKSNSFLKIFSKVQRSESEVEFKKNWEDLLSPYIDPPPSATSTSRRPIENGSPSEQLLRKRSNSSQSISSKDDMDDDLSYKGQNSNKKEKKSIRKKSKAAKQKVVAKKLVIKKLNLSQIEKKEIKNYLEHLFISKKSWVRCYTHLNFAAGKH